MAKRARKSAAGDHDIALSNIEDASSDRTAFPAATSSSRMRKRSRITAAVPADIVGDVLKRMNPKEAVRLSSVCRYWRAPALACSPTLGPKPWMLALKQSEFQLEFRLQSVADPSVFVTLNSVNTSTEYIWCRGSYHGWLLFSQGLASEHLFLLNPFSHIRISLPPQPRLCHVFCITSDPTAPSCAVIARDCKGNLMVCKPGDGSWTKGAGVCSIREFSRAVWIKEQLFVLDTMNKRLLILQLFPLWCKDIQQVSCSNFKDHKNNLFLSQSHILESEGDVLLVDVWSDYKVTALIVVRRFDWDTMAFVKVKSLGADRAVFLGDGGAAFSVAAHEAGCAADCVYFSSMVCFKSGKRASWHCYNLKKGKVVETVTDRHTDSFPNPRGEFWITPTIK